MRTNKKPAVLILDYQPIALSVVPWERYQPGVPHQAQVQTTFNVVRNPEDVRRFGVGIVCRFFAANEGENLPYKTEFALSGEFYAPQSNRPDLIPARFALNALTMLYGIARGIVGQATAGGAHGRFVLPSITFDELVDESTRNVGSGVGPDEVALEAHGNVTGAQSPASQRSKLRVARKK